MSPNPERSKSIHPSLPTCPQCHGLDLATSTLQNSLPSLPARPALPGSAGSPRSGKPLRTPGLGRADRVVSVPTRHVRHVLSVLLVAFLEPLCELLGAATVCC